MKTHTHVAARLKWLKFTPDGLAPRPSRFAVPAKFDHQGDDWRSDSWSLVVEHDRTGDAGIPQKVDIHFLADSAPVTGWCEGASSCSLTGRSRWPKEKCFDLPQGVQPAA